MDYYKLNVCGLKRDLPIIQISDDLKIASFVLLGDAELAEKAGYELSKRIDCDIIVTAEAKGIQLAHEIARNLDKESFIVARKSVKAYMNPNKCRGKFYYYSKHSKIIPRLKRCRKNKRKNSSPC